MLKFYQKERELFSLEDKIHYTNKNAEAIAKKLARHFNIWLREVKFKSGRYSYADYKNKRIVLTNIPSLRIIMHELSHLYLLQNNMIRKRHHTKKLWKIMKRMSRYARKRNYWIKIKE